MADGDTEEAVGFLKRWEPTGPWLLTAIVPDGKIESVEHQDIENLRHWIDDRQGKKNLYFSVNRPARGLIRKASKKDIVDVLSLHVDSDPQVGMDLAQEQERIKRALLEYDPKPSAVVFSGGGYQGYWRVNPTKLNGHADEIEARNRKIEADLNSGPGHCFNIDRIMRIPGTVNLPNRKKREGGRVADIAHLVYADWELRYPLDQFMPAETVIDEVVRDSNGGSVWPRMALPDRVKDLIRSGDSTDWGGDDSAAVFYVCCQMIRSGWTDEEGAVVIRNPSNGISAHVLRQKKIAEYSIRQMERARGYVGLPDWDYKDEGDLEEYEAVTEGSARPVGSNVVSLVTEAERRKPPPKDPPTPPWDPTLPPEFSDDALALRFSELHCDKLRYVKTWGQWMLWDGARWKTEEIFLAYDLARMVAREAAARSNKETFRRAITSSKTVHAIVSLARSDVRHRMEHNQWDVDINAINTPGGTLDETGFREHRREDYMTKVTAVSPGGACPKWNEFLIRVTGGDRDLVTYLARVAGYCLTGSTVEHTMFFLYGTGANGKSVFINTLTSIWGDYAKISPMDVFVDKQNENHPTEVARLRGARLVTAQETEKGKAWAESKVKILTGGDSIAARFMRADHFEFKPQFKLVIAGNNKPSLRGVDEAIKRRIHLVPFVVTIPKEERNVHLQEELKEEWGGILQWVFDGLAEYLRISLAPPKAVLDATEDYFSSEDDFGTWLEERCDLDPNSWCSSARLWNSWKMWCEQSRIRLGNRKTFGETLKSRGFESKQTGAENNARGYGGIKLKVYGGVGDSSAETNESQYNVPTSFDDQYGN